MALVKCKECGEQVSSNAKTCPNCGVNAPKKTSFITFLVLLTVILVNREHKIIRIIKNNRESQVIKDFLEA